VGRGSRWHVVLLYCARCACRRAITTLKPGGECAIDASQRSLKGGCNASHVSSQVYNLGRTNVGGLKLIRPEQKNSRSLISTK